MFFQGAEDFLDALHQSMQRYKEVSKAVLKLAEVATRFPDHFKFIKAHSAELFDQWASLLHEHIEFTYPVEIVQHAYPNKTMQGTFEWLLLLKCHTKFIISIGGMLCQSHVF